MPIELYVIHGGVEGRERLRLLSEVMGPSTRALLAEVGVWPGSTCLYAFARDPRTVHGGPRIFQAWGRNGEAGE